MRRGWCSSRATPWALMPSTQCIVKNARTYACSFDGTVLLQNSKFLRAQVCKFDVRLARQLRPGAGTRSLCPVSIPRASQGAVLGACSQLGAVKSGDMLIVWCTGGWCDESHGGGASRSVAQRAARAAHFAAAAAPASTRAAAPPPCRWSAPTASATLAKPSRSSRAASSRFTRGTSLGPS